MTSRGLFIGTFPEAGIGTPAGLGEGIWRTEIDLSTGQLSPARQVCRTPAPSFLVHDPARHLVHATSEVPDGAVTTWHVDGDTLSTCCSTPSGGVEPTHLSLLGDHLVVSNYGDGSVGVLDVSGDTVRLVRTLPHSGSGPVAGRQDSSHAHSSLPLPEGRGVLVMDLGTDEVRTVWISGDSVLEDEAHSLRVAQGSGPRHGAWRADGQLLDVTCELSGDLMTLSWDGRRPRLVGSVAVQGARLLSHLVPSGVSSHLYVADRGTGLLHVFRRPPAEADDTLPQELGTVDSGSSWPRHFAVVPDERGGEFLVVAGELAGRVHVLHRGVDRVVPELLPHGAEIPSPAFVLPV